MLLAGGVALAVVVATTAACGARTALDIASDVEGAGGATAAGGSGAGAPTAASSGDAGGGAGPEACPRPDLPARLELTDHTMNGLGNVASNGCSFAATWLELRDGVEVVVATTFRVVDGAWQAAPVAELAPSGSTGNSPEIAWDGGAYVVAWADEVLHLQRLGEDATPVGDVVTSFPAAGNVLLRWMQPTEDGSFRLGFGGHGGPAGYDVHVARIAADGAVLAPPAPLTSSGNADIAGFLAIEGENTAFWTDPIPDGVALLRARYDDEGALVDDPVTMITGANVLVSRHGAAIAGDEAYVGVLRVSPLEVVLARVGRDSHVLVDGVAGADVPVLAATARGALGVLARDDRAAPTAGLELSIVDGGVVTSTVRIGAAPSSYGYAMAGSHDTLGILAGSAWELAFWTWTP